MKGDFTRNSFDPKKHYSSVRLQQGRVGPLDAEWNEQLDIAAYEQRTTNQDVIGLCGGPKGVDSNGDPLAGFALSELNGNLNISSGRFYVHGILVENKANVLLTDQADLPDMGALPDLLPVEGIYLAYLDVWERHITALDDDTIREVALGGPDTTTRTRVIWQVKLAQVGNLGDLLTCDDFGPHWTLGAGSTGRLAAQAKPNEGAQGPCVVPSAAGYRRLENQLYRVEIHQGGALDAATFKWSRENGAVVTRWEAQDGNNLTVSSVGRDRALGFASGDWVELSDDTRDLKGLPGVLVRLSKVDGNVLTIDPTTIQGAATVDRNEFPRNPKIRRWESAGAQLVTIPVENDGWIELEDGVQIKFEAGGLFQTGDYWTIPARTAKGDVLWPRDAATGDPEFQPRQGIVHAYCPLALVEWRPDSEAPITVTADCRPLFPPLTHICAEDVCYENEVCNLPGAKTVQDALDILCQRNDLPHHNKHLHGWGIVCGLQVRCGPHDNDERGRRHITVRDGYALDCEGNNVILPGDQRLDFLEMIDRHRETHDENLLNDKGDGDVCLILNSDPNAPFSLERHDPTNSKDLLQVLLKGTLLMDFYDHCVKRIVDFVRDEFTVPAGEEQRGAGPTAERVAAFTNLAAQPVNPTTGQYIFVSEREHKIMLDFYTRLRGLLQSETYCAMFDNARPFPDYPREFTEAGMDTVFGTNYHTRLRLHPRTGEGYTVGAGLNPLKPTTTINRFDLNGADKRLLAQIDPMAGGVIDKTKNDSGVGAVQDVAFSPDGRQIYVIISSRGEENTFFRMGLLRGNEIAWQPLVMICGVKLVTLATTQADPRNVYAVGMKKITVKDANGKERTEFRGTGLYRLNPDAVTTEITPLVAFNACGHLRISDDGRAFATAAADNIVPSRYDRIMALRLPQAQPLFQGPILLGAEGSDDIAILINRLGGRVDTSVLYTVVGPQNGIKAVIAHRIADGARLDVNIPVANTALRLEPFAPTNVLLVASADGYNVQVVNLRTNEMVNDSLLPMQVGPSALAVDVERRAAYVLNAGSNTITTIENPKTLLPDFRFNLQRLAEYRAAVLNAFVDLLAGLLQYLKDCFCELLLVECPECTGEEKLYLACVSVRGGQVEKVCNFAKRKYVKSFPTVGYWLSVVPIAPLVDYLVEQFCCLALPNLFGKVVAKPTEKRYSAEYKPNVSSVSIFQGADFLRGLDIGGQLSRLFLSGRRAQDVAVDRLRTTSNAPTSQSVNRLQSLLDQPVDAVAEELVGQGISVRHEPYDPMRVANLTDVFRTPTPGSEVTLYEVEGLVRTYAVEAPAVTPVALQNRVQELAQTLHAKDSELQALRTQVLALSQQPPTIPSGAQAGVANEELVALKAELAELRKFREEVTEFMRQTKGRKRSAGGAGEQA